MFPDNFIANGCHVSETIANRLIKLRNRYAYPRAHVRASNSPAQFSLGGARWAELVHPEPGEITDLELDCYHAGLLHSTDPADNLLGTLSTVFWGFYTFSPPFATVRAMRHHGGHGARPAASPALVAQCLKADAPTDIGAALGRLGALSQLGRTPFASKVIAFMYPDRAGVLDNKIANGLAASAWARGAPFLDGIGDVRAPRYQRRYVAWCEFLCRVAAGMNAGIADGADWHWAAGASGPQEWRAIDVERAIFAHFSDDVQYRSFVRRAP